MRLRNLCNEKMKLVRLGSKILFAVGRVAFSTALKIALQKVLCDETHLFSLSLRC